MSSRKERCGPLCQHPGCWHSTNAPQEKNYFYLSYLSKLAGRRFGKTRDKSKESLGHSTLTSDGLPTLKVQTLEQDHIANALRPNSAIRRHTRVRSLPSMRTRHSRNKTALCSDSMGPEREDRKSVNFIQMHLEEEPDSVDSSDLVFSPVLIWKPGKKPHRRHTTHPSHTCTMVHVPLPVHSSPHTPTYSPSPTNRPLSRQTPTTTEVRRPKTPIHIKKKDLTNTLSPEQVNPESPDPHETYCQRVTTAEAENFSYLGDVPRQVLAEIMHQLRSESMGSIDETLPIPAMNEELNDPPPPLSHVPSSLTYDLSTKRLSRLKQTLTPKAKTTSFSRELSKRPLEVLRKQASEGTRLLPISESEFTRVSGSRTNQSVSIHLPTVQPEPPLPFVRASMRPMEALLQRQHPSLSAEHTQETEQLTEEKQISPRRINLELPQDNSFLSQKRSKSKTIALLSFNSLRPFSEEGRTPVNAKSSHDATELRKADNQRIQSVSPDFMLVGAHFTDDRLVLVDRGDKIVHQLTDTDDSEANILLTELKNDESEEIGGLPETSDSTSMLEKPSSGVRPPPSTAMDDVRPTLAAIPASPPT